MEPDRDTDNVGAYKDILIKWDNENRSYCFRFYQIPILSRIKLQVLLDSDSHFIGNVPYLTLGKKGKPRWNWDGFKDSVFLFKF